MLVINDELIDIVKRGIEGIKVKSDTIAMDEIEKIVTSTRNYLGTKHSVKNVRKEIFVPKLANRERRGIWKKNGSKDIMQVAREKVKEFLEKQKGLGLS